MFKKGALFCVVVCIGILLFIPNADAGLTGCTFSETIWEVSSGCGWNPEAADTWEYTGTYWYVYHGISTADAGATWDVSWKWQHTPIGPHDEPAGPLYTYNDSFSNGTYGFVINQNGVEDHPPHTGADSWDYLFDRSMAAGNTSIALNVVHSPEPVSSVLFITGAATLGFRRLRKKRRSSS